jgi:PAS domain S-box-containing protein
MADYQQIEEALKKCEEKFSKAFRESPLALTVTSAENDRYIEVNDMFERITGWSISETIGRTPFDIKIWVDPGQGPDFAKRLLAGDTIRNLEVRVRTKNGQIRTMSVSAVLIEITGETCVLSLIADITDLRLAEEAKRVAEQRVEQTKRLAEQQVGQALRISEQQIEQAKRVAEQRIEQARKLSERLSMVARTLIQTQDDERAAIARELHDHIDRLAMLSMVLHRIRQNPTGSESRQEIVRAIRQIDDLISDIQTLSQRLHSARLEYLGLEQAAANFCKEFADQNKVKVAFASAGIPEGLVKEISVCLFHILQEALQNAIAHGGSREFEVSLNTELDGIHLSVRDSAGIGFGPEEALEGSGVGLTIMRERLKIVGGELWIESQGERGTTIHARVPLKAES